MVKIVILNELAEIFLMPFYRHYSDYHLFGRNDGKRGKAHPEIIVYSQAKLLPNYKLDL